MTPNQLLTTLLEISRAGEKQEESGIEKTQKRPYVTCFESVDVSPWSTVSIEQKGDFVVIDAKTLHSELMC